MLLIDGARYRLWTPQDEEKEFHPMIKEHYREIFGEDSIYFDVKQVIRASSGIGSIPDAYVIKLNPPQWYVIENELATHPIYDHITNQLTKFINGIENQNARNQIIDTLYSKINEDIVLKATIKKSIATDDIYHFIYKLVSSSPKIVILINEKTPETENACHVFKYPTEIIEFKTYVREGAENVHAHFFEPLCETGKTGEQKGGAKPSQKLPPEYCRSWEAKLKWVTPNIRELANALKDQVSQLSDVDHRPSGPDYKFYRGKAGSTSIFAGIFLTQNALKVRIRTDPTKTLNDPKKWVSERTYKWFFSSGEKEFKITDMSQLDYAMELIKQSYDLTN
jgi:predicted transport protein